jgi:aspartate kinase
MLKTAKFGGSSLSDGKQFAKVRDIIRSDPSRKAVIVSAPGRRFSGDNKVTDLLYLCKAHIKYHVSYAPIFEMVEKRYRDIKAECGLSIDLDPEFEEIRSAMDSGAPVDYIASRGEYLNAKMMAEYLDFQFVDAKDCVAFNYDGSVDTERTYAQIKELFDVYGQIVMPGFYGSLPNGEIRVFSRGGSDVSGAIVAAALDADVYENWTDVSGILMVDPHIVENPKTIAKVTYSELREMSYMGATVLHADTITPVRKKDIPVNIRNTNEPDNPGTIIRESFPDEEEDGSSRFITGITGRKDFSIINIVRNSSLGSVETLRKVIDVFESYGLTITQMPCGIESFSIVTPSEPLEHCKYDLISALKRECGTDEVTIDDGISIIAIVSRHMAYRVGNSGRIFGALGANKINIRTIEQSADEINIMVGVFTEDFERAIRVLYESFAR